MLTKETIRSLAHRASSSLCWASTCNAILDAIGYDIEADCAPFEDALRGASFNFLLRNASRISSEQEAARKLQNPNAGERRQLIRWFLIVLGREICLDACERAFTAASKQAIAAIDLKTRASLRSDPETLIDGLWTEGPDLLLHRIAATALALEQAGQPSRRPPTNDSKSASKSKSQADN